MVRVFGKSVEDKRPGGQGKGLGANYVLDNVKTLNAEWTYREVAK